MEIIKNIFKNKIVKIITIVVCILLVVNAIAFGIIYIILDPMYREMEKHKNDIPVLDQSIFLKNYEQTKFLVVRSQNDDKSYGISSSNITSYDKDGNTLDSYDKDDTYSFTNYLKNDFFTTFYSYNYNKSFTINKFGKYDDYLITSSKLDPKITNYGVGYSATSKDWGVAYTNIGVVDSKYLIQFDIIENSNGLRSKFETTDFSTISGLAIDGNNMYFMTKSFPDINSENILVKYDLSTKKLVSETKISNIIGDKQISISPNLGIYVHDGVLVFGGNYITGPTSVSEQEYVFSFPLDGLGVETKINIIPTDLTNIVGLITMDQSNDSLFLLYSDSYIENYDFHLNKINSYKVIQDSKFPNGGLNQANKSSFIDGDFGYLVTNAYSEGKNPSDLNLTKFDLKDGSVIQNYTLKHPEIEKDSEKHNDYLIVPL